MIMNNMGNRYVKYGTSVFLVILLFGFITIVGASPSNHSVRGDKKCIECHSDIHRQYNGGSYNIQGQKALVKNAIMSTSTTGTMTEVIGDITLITSMGQNWYQQGIYGPDSASNDQSWGWTFFDENPPSNFMIPPEKVIQKNNIYALLLDNGNNSNPISGANVTANVTYWKYDGTSYTNNISSVHLIEDSNRKGFYNGTFYFYGGTTYVMAGMDWCDGCHLTEYYGGTDNNAGYFPGNYTVSVRAEASGKTNIKDINFEVTAWGCEDCHGSGNQHRANVNGIIPADMDSACYICHGINQITHDGTDAGNVHQNTAHRNINCANCHTNKGIDQNFNGVTFDNGGINNASIPQYNHTVVQLNGGKHFSLSCTDCHGNLTLSNPEGGYNPDRYVVNNTINKDSDFANIQRFQDYYVINVTQGGPLSIDLNWSGTSNLGFYLYPPNFNPRNRSDPMSPDDGDYPYYYGATSSNKPESYTNNTPMTGKWMVNPYGYDLYDPAGGTWHGTLQSPINYTISSTYPLEKKSLPSIPECNNCHNQGAVGGANTQYEIPNWSPGFAHADTNGDGSLDIQCRMCHNALHDIGTKTCQNCHTTAPTGHFIQEPQFGQYTISQCLTCHGDPHRVIGGSGSCIDCHSRDVNISKFGRHANLNTSDGPGIVSDKDCWTCHHNKDMNKNNIYLCESCHVGGNGIVQVTDPTLIIGEFAHGPQQCKNCHAPVKYHMNGTVGPKGFMDLFGFS